MRSMVLGLTILGVVAIGSPACAAHAGGIGVAVGHGAHGAPNWWRDAYNHGYRDGSRQAARDARQGRGSRGHGRRWDGRDERRRAYEEGYRAGYRESWSRYSRGPYTHGRVVPHARAGRYSSPAHARGYEDGRKEGRNAGRKGHGYEPTREKKYRKGDSGYKRQYGPKDAYRAQYRSGFRAGYDAGYREGRWR